MAVAIFSFSTADAQTSKKKTTTKKEKTSMQFQCPMKCEGDKSYVKNGKYPVCGMQMKPIKATEVAYQCPMKCEGDKTYAKAGKCAVCQMDLKKLDTKKPADEHEGHKH